MTAQKSEHCNCGASMEVTGSERDVVGWCSAFRRLHESCSAHRFFVTAEDFLDLKKTIEVDTTDMGELGKYVRLDYVRQRINGFVEILRARR